MTGKATILFIFILVTGISGCANKPLPTAELYQTPTPVQMDTPTPLPAFAPTSVPSLTFTPAAGFMKPDFSPILYGRKYDASTLFTVLGGVQGGVWLTPDQAVSNFAGAWEYDVYTFSGNNFQVLGDAPEMIRVGPPGYFIGTDVNVDEIGMVAVAHGWPIKQGDVEELSSENETYRQVVLDWLKAQGLTAPELGTLHIFRVDLEGDGVDEVFISATRFESEYSAKPDDYSIILMRKVTGNNAVTLPIVADVYHQLEMETALPQAYLLTNFIDLNQDGILEVVVDVQRWEGDEALIYQVDGQNIVEVP